MPNSVTCVAGNLKTNHGLLKKSRRYGRGAYVGSTRCLCVAAGQVMTYICEKRSSSSKQGKRTSVVLLLCMAKHERS